MKKKKEKSPEEIAEKLRLKKIKSAQTKLVYGFRQEIIQLGLQNFRLRLEFLKNTPNTPLPNSMFTHAETVALFERAIAEHFERI